MNGSGVGLVVWACDNENAPPTSVSTAIAQKARKADFTDSSEIKTQKRADKMPLGSLGRKLSAGEVFIAHTRRFKNGHFTGDVRLTASEP